ncbi:hypothetical protein O181_084940 [Austropuccinia psidii MF-1]|uniref:Uncharacterized protein n=1 Tax=Austropuccinia psidii MF-1 TaxID=1389203 RepID=A0A9Q3FWK9_9BASI|nr:hypothetical protein [Austropuccinia psidii MF-1]
MTSQRYSSMRICMCQPCSIQTHSSAEGDRQGVAFTPFQYKQHIKNLNKPLHPNLLQTSLLLNQDLNARKFYWIKSFQLIIHNLPRALSQLQQVSIQLRRNQTVAVKTFPHKTLE